jgi:hypothetical protein
MRLGFPVVGLLEKSSVKVLCFWRNERFLMRVGQIAIESARRANQKRMPLSDPLRSPPLRTPPTTQPPLSPSHGATDALASSTRMVSESGKETQLFPSTFRRSERVLPSAAGSLLNHGDELPHEIENLRVVATSRQGGPLPVRGGSTRWAPGATYTYR